MPERICPQCGKTFIQKNNKKKIYCSNKCYKAYYTNVYPKKRREEENQSKKAAAGSSIAEISRLARAAHMTYGQYVAAMKI